MSNFLERKSLVFLSFLSFTILFLILHYSFHDIYPADESLYLLMIRHPTFIDVLCTFFGFVYHPIYNFLNGNVLELRQFNVLLTFALGWLLCFEFFRLIVENQRTINYSFFQRFFLSAALSLSSILPLANLGATGITPNYHSLALQAYYIAALSILYLDKEVSVSSIIGWFLMAIAIWLTFMGLPTSAIGLGIFFNIYIFCCKKVNWKLILFSICVMTGLFTFTAIAVAGSLKAFFIFCQNTYTIIQASSHSPMLLFITLFKGLIPLSIFFILYYLLPTRVFLKSIGLFFLVTICLLMLFFNQHMVLDEINYILDHYFMGILAAPVRYIGLLLWLIPFLTVLYTLKRKKSRTTDRVLHNNQTAILYLILPFLLPFGTNGYWALWSTASFLGILASLALLSYFRPKELNRVFLTLILYSQIIITLVFTPALSKSLAYDGSALDGLVNIIKQHGFQPKDTMLDLSGFCLVAVPYQLEAKTVGFPYLCLPEQYDLKAYVIANINNGSCKRLSKSWVLFSTAEPFNLDILKIYGANITTDFKLMSSYPYNNYRIQIFKPIRSAETAEAACELTRQKARPRVVVE